VNEVPQHFIGLPAQPAQFGRLSPAPSSASVCMVTHMSLPENLPTFCAWQ
jgi:hypothetical protein